MAPKGNQNAKGHGCGRPKLYDLDEMAQKLEQWSKKEDALRLGDFALDVCDVEPQRLAEWCETSSNFSLEYKKAKERIASRYFHLVNKNGMNYGAFTRYIGMYDKELHAYERAEKAFDAEIRRNISNENADHEREKLLEAVKELNASNSRTAKKST